MKEPIYFSLKILQFNYISQYWALHLKENNIVLKWPRRSSSINGSWQLYRGFTMVFCYFRYPGSLSALRGEEATPGPQHNPPHTERPPERCPPLPTPLLPPRPSEIRHRSPVHRSVSYSVNKRGREGGRVNAHHLLIMHFKISVLPWEMHCGLLLSSRKTFITQSKPISLGECSIFHVNQVIILVVD